MTKPATRPVTIPPGASPTTREEAEAAVRTLLSWAGDDPLRAGLQSTPRRVAEAYLEYFSGYRADPMQELSQAVEDIGGYRDIVLLQDIRLQSYCEHHIAPFTGVAHVAYLPGAKFVGLSKVTRIVEIFGHRLQTQENLTAQIAETLHSGLEPRGVAVQIIAEHQCMSMRGVRQHGVKTHTAHFTGVFDSDAHWRDRFYQMLRTTAAGW